MLSDLFAFGVLNFEKPVILREEHKAISCTRQETGSSTLGICSIQMCVRLYRGRDIPPDRLATWPLLDS